MQVADNREQLKRQAEGLTGAAEEASKAMQLLSDAFAQQVADIEGRSGTVGERIEALIEALRKQSGDVAAAGDLANQQMTAVGQTLTERVSELERIAGLAKGDLGDLADDLDARAAGLVKSVGQAHETADKAGRAFEARAKDLRAAADEAGAQAAALAEKDEAARRDAFLKTARFLVEDLNSISIDLTRVLQGEVPDSDWKRYVKGDRTIFTRNLLRGRPAQTARRIAEKVRDEPEARKYTTRYVEQFERLLADAKAADPENLLHATFMTADVGKLYVLLNRALGRDG